MGLLGRVALLLAVMASALVAVAAAPATTQRPAAADCRSGYYENVSGRCVHRPVHSSTAPAGATARCRDRTYSFSQHASGTCSHHGGVAVWIHRP